MNVFCKGRILIVEDDARYREQLEKTFAPRGFVVKAAQGEGQSLLNSARQTVREFRPHVTIMDLRLLSKPPHQADYSGMSLIDEPDFAFTRCVVYSAYLGHNHILARELLYKPNVDDVVARQEVERLKQAVQNSFKRLCACRSEFDVRWPAAWGIGRITEAIFGKESSVPPDIIVDVLGRLFPDGAKPLRLSPLYGMADATSVARSRSVLLEASLPRRRPFVIKLAPRDRISKEVKAYDQYIDQSLGGSVYVQSRGNAVFWDVGAIHYSFVGSPQHTIKSLSAFYQQEPDPANILKPLRHFFEEAWRPHYTDSRSRLDESLFVAYDRVRGLRSLLAELQAEGGLTLPGLPPELHDPVKWVLEHEDDSGTFTSHEAVTHGDLHGDNLFVEADHAWAIDFEQSGPGPILRDFVELELDIVTRLMLPSGDDPEEFFRTALALTAPRSAKEAVRLPAPPRPTAELRKATEVVSGLRSMAADVTGFIDMREYYWGLLVALLGSSSSHKDSPQRDRITLLAAVTASRLEHWHEHWPPGWARRWPGGHPPGNAVPTRTPSPTGQPVTEYDVFVSYNRDDLEIVRQLVQRLRDAGIGVWYDREIRLGENWFSAIEEGLGQGKSCIVCYGPSEFSDWQKREQNLALSYQFQKKLRVVIPVILPGCESADEVVRGFASLSQVCDLRNGLAASEEEIQEMIAVIVGER